MLSLHELTLKICHYSYSRTSPTWGTIKSCRKPKLPTITLKMLHNLENTYHLLNPELKPKYVTDHFDKWSLKKKKLFPMIVLFHPFTQVWEVTWWPSRPAASPPTSTTGACLGPCPPRWHNTGLAPAWPSAPQVSSQNTLQLQTHTYSWNRKFTYT